MTASMLFRSVLVVGLLAGTLTGRSQEWERLFDGKTMAGWQSSDDPGSFKIENGAIICQGPRAHLFYTNGSFKDFDLSLEVMTRPGANSGVYFHTRYQPGGWPTNGFEVQVCNSPQMHNGYRENKLTGSLYGLRNIYKQMAADERWFELRIEVRGNRVRTWVDTQLLVDYREPQSPGRKRLSEGTFALQCHDPESRVAYRNIRLRRVVGEPSEVVSAPAFDEYDREVIRWGSQNYPMINYHLHLKGGLTLPEVLADSRRTGVFPGIAVNCGLNFSITNDAGIYAYLRENSGQPAFVAMQAEGREWVKMFSKEAVAAFDYVFSDAMTIVDDSGRRMRLWLTKEVPPIPDPEAFMEMLVDRTVRIIREEPINVYVNPTYLPSVIAPDYDKLWTEGRMSKVISAAAQRGIAIEINSRLRLPKPAFLKLAKAAGCKFTMGTNNPEREIGRIDYGLEMIRELNLRWDDFWVPPTRTKRAL